jgi:hypothetical protein
MYFYEKKLFLAPKCSEETRIVYLFTYFANLYYLTVEDS